MCTVYPDPVAVSQFPVCVTHGCPPERLLPSAIGSTASRWNRYRAFRGFKLSEALHLNLPDHLHLDQESL